jgi:hypothetical protein
MSEIKRYMEHQQKKGPVAPPTRHKTSADGSNTSTAAAITAIIVVTTATALSIPAV